MYFIPVLISTVVIAQLWSKIYNADYGLLNVLLQSIGLSSLAQDWLGQKDTALAASFIPTLWQYVGYHMLLMYAGAKSVSQDVLEAARMDGASLYSHGVVHYDPANEADSEGKPRFFRHRCVQGV
ncbi:sugar ABC transporter permease [Paenibacillus amylolyticus]|nr:sugar ABC transporter permease [Paenibacillus amylolyticus]